MYRHVAIKIKIKTEPKANSHTEAETPLYGASQVKGQI